MGRKSKAGVLHKFPYPPYALRTINRTDLVVCGGGGEARTGVPNHLEVLRLRAGDVGLPPSVEVLHCVDTDPYAVMSLDVLSFDKAFRVFTSQGENCLEYIGHLDRASAGGAESGGKEEEEEEEETVRRRQKADEAERAPAAAAADCRLEAFRRVRTDRTCQNVVRVAASGGLLVTGGVDGTVRVFTVADLQLVREMKAHEGEIGDVDMSPNGARICTVAASAKEKYAVLWRAHDGSRVVELALTKPPGPTAYRFRHCRYGRLPGSLRVRRAAAAAEEEEGAGGFALYTTHIPVTRAGPRGRPEPCYVTAWDCVKYRPRVVAPVGADVVCSLAVSDEGRYVGLGCIEGSVAVLTAFNLQTVYRLPGAHAIFVTAVDFLPAVSADRNGSDCELVSCSADNVLRWHRVPRRAQYSFLWPVVGALVMIFALFYTMAQLGL